MEIERVQAARPLWRAALLDAAGVVSAYFAPRDYSLGSFEVRGIATGSADFEAEVAARLDFGRVSEVRRLLPKFPANATTAFRHRIIRSEGFLRGRPHIPRYLRDLARGVPAGIPVITASKDTVTPENLFLSEVLRLSARTCAAWSSRGGAEARIASAMARDIAMVEDEEPWKTLRSQSRPTLLHLSSIVRGRIVAGAIPSGGLADLLSRLFPPHPITSPSIFEEIVDALLFVMSSDARFEDRLFELVCLGWVVEALRSRGTKVVIDTTGVKASSGRPIAVGNIGNAKIEVFFQTSQGLAVGRWADKKSGAALRGIPDIVIRGSRLNDNDSQILLIDAKNRTLTSESEVIYKLLGYKENFGLDPFVAIGLYPSVTREFRIRSLHREKHSVQIFQVPLVSGKRFVRRLSGLIFE